MTYCELCDGTTDDRMESFGWGWCDWCQHGTRDVEYSEIAPDYETDKYASHNGDFEYLKKEWQTNVEQLKKHAQGVTVLDIGFLEGSGMGAMASAGFNVFGFDVSDAAFRKATGNGIDAARLQVDSELTESVFGGKRFNAITCREVIEHVPDPDGMLRTFAKLLRTKGIVQVQTPLFDHAVRFWDCEQHLRCFSVGSLVTMAERNGLRFLDGFGWPGGMCMTFRKAE